MAIELAGLPRIPYSQGSRLDRRKSKIVSSDHPSSNVYLDIVGLPHLTRNVSESQLIALKSAGSKALSNVTQQFSKLGTPFKNVRSKNTKFTIGFGSKQDSSSESEEEYENSIFQPNDRTDSNSSVLEEGIEATEDSITSSKKSEDSFLPSVGIVMGSQSETEPIQTLERKENMLSLDDSSQVNEMQLSSVIQNPEIHIICDIEPGKLHPKADQHKLSHSCGEMDSPLGLNIAQSQSESALKNKLQNLTSPVANVTKDLVFSPFSKLAKGVQNLGANLDVRKLSVGGVKQGRELEEQRRMQEKWKDCKTRLIML